MSKLLDKLIEAKEKGVTLAVALNGKELIVKVEAEDNELITIKDTKSTRKYYLHYTAVVLCG
ncbi:MAG: hypothetical protein HZA22_08735 [Nitrospirae bacterium]|nr:hypothetical protein [Nitrospirota bacterium]